MNILNMSELQNGLRAAYIDGSVAALTVNKEWNTKLISTENGEVTQERKEHS